MPPQCYGSTDHMVSVTFSDFKPIFSRLSPKRPTMSSRFHTLSYLIHLILSNHICSSYLKDHRTRHISENKIKFIYLLGVSRSRIHSCDLNRQLLLDLRIPYLLLLLQVLYQYQLVYDSWSRYWNQSQILLPRNHLEDFI